jgi:3-hydroxyacyl-CoA dehydrogenase
LLVSLIKAGRLGRKTGAGFFSYRSNYGDPANPSERATPLPCKREILVGRTNLHAPIPPHQLVLPMLLEATRLLEEGKVRDAREIDLAVLFGLGFPVEKGGLLWWADTLGAEGIVALLRSLPSMGSRAEPTPLLKTLASTGGRFYPERHRIAS